MRAAALVLLVAGAAAAAPNPGGMGNPNGVRVYQSGSYVADCQAFDFAASDWAVALVGGGICTLDAGSSVLLDNGGQIGAAADFSSIVDLSGTAATVLPAGTADAATACTAGSIYMETDDATISTTRTQLCTVTGSPGTWKWIGDITSGGQAGGQSITGGTAAADSLTLNPTSSGSPTTGRVKACAGNPSLSNNPSGCISLFPDGFSEAVGAGGVLSAISLGGTLAQTDGNAPVFSVLRAAYTWDLQGTGAAFIADQRLLSGEITLQNSNTNAVVLPAGGRALDFIASCQKAGSGTNFTVPSFEPSIGRVGTIGTGCTVTDFVAGARAGSGGTVNGTLTTWWGFLSDAPTVGTARFQYGGAEHTITGTPPSGKGGFGIESGAPNRFYFINESGHIWRTGYATAIGGVGTYANVDTAVQNTIAADNTTRFFNAYAMGFADTTEGDVDNPVMENIKVFAMSCGVSSAPGSGGDTRTFQLRDDAANVSGIACTMTNTDTRCNARVEAGVSIAAGSLIDWSSAATNTPANTTQVTCAFYYTVDTF